MKCKVCSSGVAVSKIYDNHLESGTLKGAVKELLPYVDFIIPQFVKKLKIHSAKKTPFKGFVKVCTNCGHGIMRNPPTMDALQRYYQSEYWHERPEPVESVKKEKDDYLTQRAIHQTEFMMDMADGHAIANILEIGAGAAYTSLLLKKKFEDAAIGLYVCEPAKQWEDHYRKHGIIRVAEYFPFQTDVRFDYIHTSHWLEHVCDLNATLSELSALMNPSGYIFVEVPNTEHSYWDMPIFDRPHIHFFTRQSLTKVFKDNDFECLKIGEYGITWQEWYDEIPLSFDRYGACEKGFWIRALFRKSS